MITKLKDSTYTFTHIIHIADIHVKLLKRHQEYLDIFNKFYNEVKKTSSTTLIAILGDIFHNKSDLSPECVKIAADFLYNCSELRPTIIVAGNHDATLVNKNRLDCITPVVTTLNHKNLFYLKNNGLYGFGNILFNNYSVFSDSCDYLPYEKIPSVYKNEYKHHIVLYHGPVDSSLTDLGFYMKNKSMPVEIFDGHHIALLGDIHRKQDMQIFEYEQNKPAVHYPGSLIMQNHGESISGHGYSLWDLSTKTYKHIEIPNDYGFFTVEINKGKLVTDLTNIPKKARIRVKCFESITSEVKSAISEIKKYSDVDEITYVRVESPTDCSKLKINTNINLSDLTSVEYQNKLITEFLKSKGLVDEKKITGILDINTKTNKLIKNNSINKNIKWKPKKFEFDNMFSYGEGNIIDFTKAKDIVGLFAPNAFGKSSILSALSFCLFDKYDRGYKASHILNVQKSKFKCKFNFEINNVDFFIERVGESDRKGNVKVNVEFWKVVDGKKIKLNGEDRRNTNDIIEDYLGTYDDFVLTSLSVQNVKNSMSFIDIGQSERKDLLSRFLGLSIFDKLLEQASEKYKELSIIIKNYKKDDFESKLLIQTNQLSQLTSLYNDENSTLPDHINEKNKLTDDIIEQTKQIIKLSTDVVDIEHVNKQLPIKEKEIKQFESLINKTEINIDNINKELINIESSLHELEDKKVVVIYEKYQQLESKLVKANHGIDLKQSDINNKNKKLEMLKKHEYDPKCKYCVNSVFVKDAIKTQNELNKDMLDLSNMLIIRDEIIKQISSLKWIIESVAEYNSLSQKKNNINNKHSELICNLSNYEKQINKLKADMEKLIKNRDDYNKQKDDIEHNLVVEKNIMETRKNLSNIEFIINQKNRKLSEIHEKKVIVEKNILDINVSIDNIKKMEIEHELYVNYIKCINRDGVPYEIISNIIPEIEKEVNNILSQMVEFHLDIEIDGKNIIPYIAYDDDKRWPIEMSSGFERFISSLAIRVALSNISNLQKPSFYCIDEGWGVLDSENLASVKVLLQFMKSTFDFILIISHIDYMKDVADSIMEIKQENGFSKIQFI